MSAAPLPVARSVLGDAGPGGQFGIREIEGVMASIALQSVADGRVTVLMDRDAVDCTLEEVVLAYAAHFRDLPVPITVRAGGSVCFVDRDFDLRLERSAPSASVFVLGFLNCSATFGFVSDDDAGLPEFASYPLVCVGFACAPASSALVNDFSAFVRGRKFPFADVRSVWRRRSQLEVQNRDFAFQTVSAARDLRQRFVTAQGVCRRRAEQLAAAVAQIRGLSGRAEASGAGATALRDVRARMDRLDAEINALFETGESLAGAADAKQVGRAMSRREELSLLAAMRQRVRDARQQVAALKEQE